jgi:predicted nucleic acid-binding protein
MKKYSRQWLTPEQPKTIEELKQVGLSEEVAAALREIVATGFNENEVVASFLFALTQSDMSESFDRAYSRVIQKNWKVVVKNHDVDVEVQKVLQLFIEEYSLLPLQAGVS